MKEACTPPPFKESDRQKMRVKVFRNLREIGYSRCSQKHVLIEVILQTEGIGSSAPLKYP